MNAQSKIEPPTLAKLREPFPDNQISKLPKESRRQIDERKQGKNVIYDCPECGGIHHKNTVHLDYVGHAAATDRLLDTDLEWDWEPFAVGPDGLPALDKNGGLWIKLTVLGKTRIGYGHADGKQGGDAIKEAIGDAIRNAGMRFGMALHLWHKGALHVDPDEDTEEPRRGNTQRASSDEGGMPDAEWAKLAQLLKATKTDAAVLIKHFKVKNLRQLNQEQYGIAIGRLTDTLAKMAKEESNAKGNDDGQQGWSTSDGDLDDISDSDVPF